MTPIFVIIFEDFEQDLDAIKILIESQAQPRLTAKARVAGVNASVLLLAATFEAYVRELAREYARAVVAATPSYDKLPSKLSAVAWKRTMEGLARIHSKQGNENSSRESILSDAQRLFLVTYIFCMGNLSQYVYTDLIHNENNMRTRQLNSLFNVSGLGNTCG